METSTSVPSAAAVHGNSDDDLQIVAIAPEHLVRENLQFDIKIAGRPTTRADLSVSGEMDAVPGAHAGRNLDVDGPVGSHPSVTGTFDARVLDDRSVSTARSGTVGWCGCHR